MTANATVPVVRRLERVIERGPEAWCIGDVWQLLQDARDAIAAAPQPEDACYGIIDPDYARIYTIARCLAWSEGYALTLHGSFTRDLDLVAVPWADRCCDPEHLVRRIVDAAGLHEHHTPPSVRPHGRLTWTLHLPGFGDPRWVDLSVLPITRNHQPVDLGQFREAVDFMRLCGKKAGKESLVAEADRLLAHIDRQPGVRRE